MNTEHNNQFPNNQMPQIDKTYIEGETPVPPSHTSLQPGTRIPAGQNTAVNPYQTQIQQKKDN